MSVAVQHILGYEKLTLPTFAALLVNAEYIAGIAYTAQAVPSREQIHIFRFRIVRHSQFAPRRACQGSRAFTSNSLHLASPTPQTPHQIWQSRYIKHAIVLLF